MSILTRSQVRTRQPIATTASSITISPGLASASLSELHQKPSLEGRSIVLIGHLEVVLILLLKGKRDPQQFTTVE